MKHPPSPLKKWGMGDGFLVMCVSGHNSYRSTNLGDAGAFVLNPVSRIKELVAVVFQSRQVAKSVVLLIRRVAISVVFQSRQVAISKSFLSTAAATVEK